MQVLRELMQILSGELGQTLVDLLLREAPRSEHLGDLLVGGYVADQGEIGIPGGQTLIGRGLRGHWSGE